MKHDPSLAPAVVVYVNGLPAEHGTGAQGHLRSSLSGSGAGNVAPQRAAYDPHEIHRDFPERWQAYILANYRGVGHIVQVFSVSERTARKWMSGETGAVGGHVAIAVREHPIEAPRMLFAA